MPTHAPEASPAERRRLARVARGLEPADLVVRNARVVDVFGLETFAADVAVAGGRVAGVGEYQDATDVLDARGATLAPGLVDGHLHLESSLLTPGRFADLTLGRGTVGVVAEPHELVNVLGIDGLAWTLAAGLTTAQRVWASVPSCVPASPFERGGASVSADDVRRGLRLDGAVGLAEMMNVPGVLGEDEHVWAVMAAAAGRRDGHAAGVTGRDLAAYAAAGLHSDHEATAPHEALERLRAGLWLMVRDGSAARNLAALAPVLAARRPHRAMLVSDDVDAGELAGPGHLDRLLREAVRLGLPPEYAVRLASLGPAEYWNLGARGAVAPGHAADLVLLEDLRAFRVIWTMVGGRIVAREGEVLESSPASPALPGGGVRLPAAWGERDLALAWRPGRRSVIGVLPDQIITRHLELELPRDGDRAVPDPSRDLAKVAVVARHDGSGRTGVALAQGTGVRRGAIAQTVLHDSHNLIALGARDSDMVLAAREVQRRGGGVAVVLDGRLLAALDLPVGGLVSDAPAREVVAGQARVEAAARELGCSLPHPIVTLSFLGLTVIPSLKLTDRGLFDAVACRLLDA